MSFTHPHPFDPTYGYSLEELLNITPPEPFPGLEDFWRSTYEEAVKVSPRLELTPGGLEVEGYTVYAARFDAWDPAPGVIRRIGGWLLVPHQKPVCAIVQSHGYGDPGLPVAHPSGLPAIRLHYHTRGFGVSLFEDLPKNTAAFHVIHQIETKENYVLRGCAADVWGAASALLEYAPELASTLYYAGISFGGGIGALATPWDPRLKRVFWGEPTFSNHPIRVQCQNVGSGEAVRQYYLRRPEVMEVLRYYDSAATAAFLKVPAIISCSVFDPAVAPPGQFSVYNAVKSCKELFIEPAGHFDYPEWEAVAKAREDRVRVWLTPNNGM